jgi:hypothetical protein
MPASDRIGSILVLSNGPAEDGYNYYHLSSPPLNRVERDGFPYFDGYYASQSTVPNPRDLQVSRELVLGDFQTPAVIEQTNAAIYGHLPLIGDLDVADGDSPAVLAEEQAHANELRDVVYGPVTDSSSQLPSSYSTPYGGRAELFWIPRNFSISETLETVTPFFLQNEQPDYITPPGKFSEGNYVWEANTDLEATFESTNQDAAQAESNNAFLSGIIFGVAGAAAIALVQEIPETFSMPAWWPLGKRRHKSLRFSQQA